MGLGTEGIAVSTPIAALNASDPEPLRVVLTCTADLLNQAAAVLVAQASRTEDCPYCAHPAQTMEVRSEELKENR